MHRVACDIRCELGEGPLWSAREDAIYWVDITGASLHRRTLADGEVKTWQMPEKIGWVAERRETPGLIAGLKSGFHLVTLDPFCCTALVDPEPDRPGNRMNDAKVDHLGRIWAGTMDDDEKESTGSLYRLDGTWKVSKHDSGYRVTNGPALDPDRGRFYHSDTARGIVYCFDMTAAGEIANKRLFVRFTPDQGYPDGMTVDAEGGLWIAHWGGGRVTRFSTEGQPERHVELPVSQVTSCTFGGEQLDRLFVTSAARGREHEPQAGMLFEVDPGVRGRPTCLFAG